MRRRRKFSFMPIQQHWSYQAGRFRTLPGVGYLGHSRGCRSVCVYACGDIYLYVSALSLILQWHYHPSSFRLGCNHFCITAQITMRQRPKPVGLWTSTCAWAHYGVHGQVSQWNHQRLSVGRCIREFTLDTVVPFPHTLKALNRCHYMSTFESLINHCINQPCIEDANETHTAG